MHFFAFNFGILFFTYQSLRIYMLRVYYHSYLYLFFVLESCDIFCASEFNSVLILYIDSL
jgi:hypothetical protein